MATLATGHSSELRASSHSQIREAPMLKFGVSMFFTDYSMGPGELGQALEQRGFESVWAPEHSHIPVSRKTPFPCGGRSAEEVLRLHGPLRDTDRGRDGDKDAESRHRGVFGTAARSHPDREARGI